MNPGRCEGCGKENKSCKKIKIHILGCEEFKRLWRDNPERALEPDVSYQRHRGVLEDTKDKRREVRIAGMRTRDRARLDGQAKRWGTATAASALDLLADAEDEEPP